MKDSNSLKSSLEQRKIIMVIINLKTYHTVAIYKQSMTKVEFTYVMATTSVRSPFALVQGV